MKKPALAPGSLATLSFGCGTFKVTDTNTDLDLARECLYPKRLYVVRARSPPGIAITAAPNRLVMTQGTAMA